MKTYMDSLTLAITVAIIAVVFIESIQVAPRCQPGDKAIYVGGLLMSGCPNTKHQTYR